MERLLDFLPTMDSNESSKSDPIINCDRGYGKKKVIELLAKRNFKVITIANAVRSEHPIIAFIVVDTYKGKHLYSITNVG
jgi:hypothetical protein